MRVGNLLPSRLAYYDRAFIERGFTFEQQGLAPAADTTRGIYFVPVAKKFVVESCLVIQERAAVAAPAGLNYCRIITQTSLGIQVTICSTRNTSNVLGAYYNFGLTANSFLANPGVVLGTTQDLGTGGTQNVALYMKGSEFDA